MVGVCVCSHTPEVPGPFLLFSPTNFMNPLPFSNLATETLSATPMTQADRHQTFTQSFHVKDHPSLSTRPWDVEDPFIVQAVAESEICARDKDLPKIIGLVREASIPSLLGNPACTPNNFYDYLASALESSPEGFLEALDHMESVP